MLGDVLGSSYFEVFVIVDYITIYNFSANLWNRLRLKQIFLLQRYEIGPWWIAMFHKVYISETATPTPPPLNLQVSISHYMYVFIMGVKPMILRKANCIYQEPNGEKTKKEIFQF